MNDVLTIEKEESGLWHVRMGDKYCHGLAWEEMVGVVTALTMPAERPCIHWLRTADEHLHLDRRVTAAAGEEQEGE